MEAKRKHCYKCNIKYPLFMFRKADGFSVSSQLGRVFVCRICTFITSKKSVVRRQSDGSLKVVKLTLKERIKELFS